MGKGRPRHAYRKMRIAGTISMARYGTPLSCRVFIYRNMPQRTHHAAAAPHRFSGIIVAARDKMAPILCRGAFNININSTRRYRLIYGFSADIFSHATPLSIMFVSIDNCRN